MGTVTQLPSRTQHQHQDAIRSAIGTCTRFRSLGAAAAASGRELTPAVLDALWDQATAS